MHVRNLIANLIFFHSSFSPLSLCSKSELYIFLWNVYFWTSAFLELHQYNFVAFLFLFSSPPDCLVCNYVLQIIFPTTGWFIAKLVVTHENFMYCSTLLDHPLFMLKIDHFLWIYSYWCVCVYSMLTTSSFTSINVEYFNNFNF